MWVSCCCNDKVGALLRKKSVFFNKMCIFDDDFSNMSGLLLIAVFKGELGIYCSISLIGTAISEILLLFIVVS